MKISKQSCCRYKWLELRCVTRGCVVYFESSFHQDMSTADPYLMIDASAYPNHDNQGRKAAVNLRTGKLSYLLPDRRVRIIDAEVCLDD
jgi:hypothetical protein